MKEGKGETWIEVEKEREGERERFYLERRMSHIVHMNENCGTFRAVESAFQLFSIYFITTVVSAQSR